MDKAKLANANREGRTHTSFVAICRQEGKGLQGRVKSKQRFSFCYLSRRAYGTISLRDAASLVEASPVASIARLRTCLRLVKEGAGKGKEKIRYYRAIGHS